MKISRAWLQTFFDATLPEAAALSEALTFHAFEIDGIERVGDDEVLDVKVTANRGHDCLSHRGIAKELSAILELPLSHDPLRVSPTLEPKNESVRVTVAEALLCPRFTAALITDIRVGPSPQWLSVALETLGQRSINNVVDATNYVMFGLGQPLHAFDAGKLVAVKAGPLQETYALTVRAAKSGESMLGLDDKTYILTPDMLVIADGNAEDIPVSIAGIKGGKPTGIDEATTSIILEAANWNGANIRKTSQTLKLRTEASSRFEQVITPELAPYGLAATIELILKIAGGTIAGYTDVYPSPAVNASVTITTLRINAVLGSILSSSDVEDALKRLDLSFVRSDEVFIVTPPMERLDILIPEDLIEEVGRIIGYDKIPETELPALPNGALVNPNFNAAEKVREQLMSQGYSEVFTSAFADTGERVIANKVDGVRPYLRESLLPGLAAALEKNKANRDILGLEHVKIFEIGTVWKGGEEVVMIGTAVEEEKGVNVMENPLEPLKSQTYERYPLSDTLRYQPFSRYPYIVRDIALWAPSSAKASEGKPVEEQIIDLIRTCATELLVKDSLFDRFEKGERVSLAFRLIFQSFEKTLTDAEVNSIMDTISAELKKKGFEIR